MLTNDDVEQLFFDFKTPPQGCALIRKIRTEGPVRELQHRNDGVRVRFISRKMNRALLAESRTVEFPGIYIREFDPCTLEMWPQPCLLDLSIQGEKGKTRLQHTPDLFVIEETGFLIEEWRQEERLLKAAIKYPERFYKDEAGLWHYLPIEEHLASFGIRYRLRSANEHPRVLLSNLAFLEDFTLESAPVVPQDERNRLVRLLAAHKRIDHASLVIEHSFKADHVFQMVLDKTVYVNLNETLLHKVDELVIYQNEAVAVAEKLILQDRSPTLPASALRLTIGSHFLFEGKRYETLLVGDKSIVVKDDQGISTTLPLQLLQELHQSEMVTAAAPQPTPVQSDRAELFNKKDLAVALERLRAINEPEASDHPARTLRRWRKQIAGAQSYQDQLELLLPGRRGNFSSKVPPLVHGLAQQVLDEFHNKPNKPTVSASYGQYVLKCAEESVVPMARSNFYRWVGERESVLKREGRRQAYQVTPIALTYDYAHPVHGVQPHEVVYCDHTPMNIFLRGMVLPDLGKPTLTLMSDGALSKSRAFFLSYLPASSVSVFMCLRDYVRRHKRLPRVLVLDNGREFHSEALVQFCGLFGIKIRWRRRSRPRDSSHIERMFGATETEVLAQLKGNSVFLKNPRMVSTTHLPSKHIEWTLPALHGALEHYLFEVHPTRVHPRFGVSSNEFEKHLLLQYGNREHLMVRFDQTFKLLTASHSGASHRQVDRIRGVYVDGIYYWHDLLGQAKKGASVEVRVELWNASVVYVSIEGNWVVARARDGRALEGRFRPEFEMQMREESRRKQSIAQADRSSVRHSRERALLWKPENWDNRLREQVAEMYTLYEKLALTEVFAEGKNDNGREAVLTATNVSRNDYFDVEEKLSAASDTCPIKVQTTEPISSPPSTIIPDEDDYF